LMSVTVRRSCRPFAVMTRVLDAVTDPHVIVRVTASSSPCRLF
jgi:hypothetical protein